MKPLECFSKETRLKFVSAILVGGFFVIISGLFGLLIFRLFFAIRYSLEFDRLLFLILLYNVEIAVYKTLTFLVDHPILLFTGILFQALIVYPLRNYLVANNKYKFRIFIIYCALISVFLITVFTFVYHGLYYEINFSIPYFVMTLIATLLIGTFSGATGAAILHRLIPSPIKKAEEAGTPADLAEKDQ
jgi:hypothetical protein